MSERDPHSGSPAEPRSRMPIRWRTVAILIMIGGALGFAVSLLVFREQILCLFFSTLVTLAGLGVNVAARRFGWEKNYQPDSTQSTTLIRRHRGLRPQSAPPGLRASRVKRLPVQTPIQAPAQDLPSQSAQSKMNERSFTGSVIRILQSQGARVQVESQREDRAILEIIAPGERRYVALILEADIPVDVSDVRALLGLVRGSDALRGYLVAQAAFSQRAYLWAADHQQIRLVSGDELDELSI